MRPLFLAYRVLATVVGLSIATLTLVGIPLKYVHAVFPSVLPEGTAPQQLGADINLWLGTAHGFIYMAFVLVALLLAMRARWPVGFTVVTLLLGTVPLASFWAEARAVRRVRAEHPEVEERPEVRTPDGTAS